VNTLATAFAEGVEKLRRKHSDFLVRLRQLGLFMGLEFIDDWSGPLVTSTSYHQGLWMIWANNDKRVMQFLPPLNIELALVDEIMEKLDVALIAAKQLKGMA
jgi:putrescine aminotransferase